MDNSVCNFSIIDIIHINRNKCSIKTVDKAYCVLSCRINGKSKFFYEEKELLIDTGNVIFAPSGSSYSQETDGEEVICFHLETDKKFMDKVRIFKFENSEEIKNLFIHAYSVWKKKENNCTYKSLSDLYNILSRLEIRKTTVCPEIIKKAVEYINTHMFETQFSINTAFVKSNISRTYFNRVFKEFYGCTPVNYINKKRINKAKMLLNTGNYTKEEIAFLCGFDNVKYFYTLFKKLTGVTTGGYIKNKNASI